MTANVIRLSKAKIAEMRLNSERLDIADALDNQINVTWGLIAILHQLCETNGGDPHMRGALQIASNHRDALQAIRDSLDRQ